MLYSQSGIVASVYEAGSGGPPDRPLEQSPLIMACILHEADWGTLRHREGTCAIGNKNGNSGETGQDHAHGGNDSGSNSVGSWLTH